MYPAVLLAYFIVTVNSKKAGIIDPENDGTVVFRNVGKALKFDMAKDTSPPESSPVKVKQSRYRTGVAQGVPGS
jgi:hypothetical protein